MADRRDRIDVPLSIAAGAPMVRGRASAPFESAPGAEGATFPFMICWSTDGDLGSGVIAKAHGLNADELLPVSGMDNTDVYRMLYSTLFGEEIE